MTTTAKGKYLLGSGRFLSELLLNHVSRRSPAAQSQPGVLAPFREPAAIACPTEIVSGPQWNLAAHFLGRLCSLRRNICLFPY